MASRSRARRPRRHGGDRVRQAISISARFRAHHLMERLPDYARPLFLRILGAIAVTATLKPRKATSSARAAIRRYR